MTVEETVETKPAPRRRTPRARSTATRVKVEPEPESGAAFPENGSPLESPIMLAETAAPAESEPRIEQVTAITPDTDATPHSARAAPKG